jgi:CheY-like chemotaxis protein
VWVAFFCFFATGLAIDVIASINNATRGYEPSRGALCRVVCECLGAERLRQEGWTMPDADMPVEELELLRRLVRGQIHRLNNILATCNFAIAMVPEAQQQELRNLIQEMSRELKDLRNVGVPPSTRLQTAPPTFDSILRTAASAALNASDGPVTIGGLDALRNARHMAHELAWSLYRMFFALFLCLDRKQCRHVEVIERTESRQLCLRYEHNDEATRPTWKPGFGMAVALAARLGGAVTKREGGGSASLVMVALPLKPATRQLERRRVATSVNVDRSPVESLLVVEDNASLASYLRLVLRSTGIRSSFASSFAEAVELFEATRPEAILIDRHLGEHDGLTLARHLRDLRPVKVIIMSGDEPSSADRDLLTGCGALGYLVKPFEYEELVEILSSSEHGQAEA